MRRIPKTLAFVVVGALVLPATAFAGGKPPKNNNNSISIAANPLRVLFPRTVALTGKLTGNDHAGKSVNVQADDYPFGTYRTVQTVTTNSAGDWAATVAPSNNTKFRVVAKTAPDVTSPEALVTVVKRVSLTANDRSISKGTTVTFSGKVSPAHDGAKARFQRRSSTGSWVTLREPTLLDDGTARSRYEVKLKVNSDSVYRTVVKADADHGTGKSRGLTVNVS